MEVRLHTHQASMESVQHLPVSDLSRSFIREDEDGRPLQDTSFGGALGGKNIGIIGSFCLVTNNITGPGMLHIAAVFQKSGFVVPLIVFIMICVGSAGASTLLCDAMARMPGNGQFDLRYEFSDIISYFLGRRWFVISQATFFFGIFTQAAASIVGTAQSMDSLVAFIFGKTWALQVTGPAGTPWFLEWDPAHFCGRRAQETGCVPFAHLVDQNGYQIGMVFTAGYVVTMITMMPMGFLNLDDNIKFQIGSFVFLVVLCGEFIYEMLVVQGQAPSLMPAIGLDYSSMVGTILFNFAYCPTLPSWMNEKKPEVPTTKLLWSSAIFSTLMYILIGAAGAMAFPGAETNLLQVLGSRRSSGMTRICSYLFGSLVIGLGIPVFCIVMRYNLVVGGLTGSRATFLGVALPWAVSWLLYQGSAAENFISLSGVVLVSAIGFVLPLMGAIVAAQCEDSLAASGREVQRNRFWVCGSARGISETVVKPLPSGCLPNQRRCAAVLLCMMIPLVLFGFADQLLVFAT